MKRFKRKTLALVLASVVTVVGAFGANNYKNSLMGLKFENTANGGVNMFVQTKSLYNGDVTLLKKDVNTYVLTLPEVYSEAAAPNLDVVSTNIASVNIRTMPYSNEAKGYTRITVKTNNPSLNLQSFPQIYVPPTTNTKAIATKYTNRRYVQNPSYQQRYDKVKPAQKNYGYVPEKQQPVETPQLEEEQETVYTAKDSIKQIESVEPITTQEIENKDIASASHSDFDVLYLLLWGFVIASCSWFFYTKAKNTMLEISGENFQIDVSEEPKKEQKTKKTSKTKTAKKISNAIKTLDKTYAQSNLTELKKTTLETEKNENDNNVVDLDKLFNEQKEIKATSTFQEANDDENEALEAFLSGFSFDESLYEEAFNEDIVEESFDNEFYEKIINSDSLVFTKEDIKCIKQLINSEINNEIIDNIEKYAISNPIKRPDQKEILENLITTYTISQDIKFTTDDISTLNKLINIELDTDFVKNLSVENVDVDKYQKQIKDFGDKPKKVSKISTLNVKDMLPNLSEELKKQGNKEIEYNKPEVIYYKEGYDVNILSLKESLPNLSTALKEKSSYKFKPSAKFDVVDKNYNVGDAIISDVTNLPDLKDVLANPDKYENKEESKVEVDEKSLLDTLSNVKFKSFYDESNQFEVLNDFDNTDDSIKVNPELNNFENFEVIEDILEEQNSLNNSEDIKYYDDKNVIDLDNKKEKKVLDKQTLKTELRGKSQKVQDIKQKIEEARLARNVRRERISQDNRPKLSQDKKDAKISNPTKNIIDGEAYTILSSVSFDDSKGCHLAKNEKGYFVYAYIGDKVLKLKEYETIKSEKIQARINEKLPDETTRYLIRIGLQKFVIDVKDDDIKYVMDLC